MSSCSARLALVLALVGTAVLARDVELEMFLKARDAGCSHVHPKLHRRQDGGTTTGTASITVGTTSTATATTTGTGTGSASTTVGHAPTTTGTVSTHYNCDESKCTLPNCHCASTSPPGGLSKDEVPQFVLFTAEDAIQTYTLDAVNSVLAGRRNPNGCLVTMTYFASIQYTNMSMVTDWYVAGNEIADHTMTHVGNPSADEIIGNAAALNAFAGIPQSALTGFRAPNLNYSVEMLQTVHDAQFEYDSSATSVVRATDPQTDAWWPYTLDYGLANNCRDQPCGDEGPKIPGLWEVPLYAVFDEQSTSHMMDPWLDAAEAGNTTLALTWMQNAFTDHYRNGNRQPFGIYTHPLTFANVPSANTDPEIARVINAFLDWAQMQQNVWVVSHAQLIAWMRNPVPASQLNSIKEFQCQTPNVQGAVCNGIAANEAGLLKHCKFTDAPWHTCYGCPVNQPGVNDPTPEQDLSDGQPPRYRLPSNCSTAFFDPIANKCLCNQESCLFNDVTKPIGPNGSNLTSGGTGAANDSGKPGDPYRPFALDSAPHGSAVAFGAAALAIAASLFAL